MLKLHEKKLLNYRAILKYKVVKKKKKDTYEIINSVYEGTEVILNAIESRIFPLKSIYGKGIKVLTPRKMIQRLAVALAKKIIYSFYRGNNYNY